MTESHKNDEVTCFLIVFTRTFLSLQTKLYILPWNYNASSYYSAMVSWKGAIKHLNIFALKCFPQNTKIHRDFSFCFFFSFFLKERKTVKNFNFIGRKIKNESFSSCKKSLNFLQQAAIYLWIRLLRGNIWKREKYGFFNYYEAMKLDLKIWRVSHKMH